MVLNCKRYSYDNTIAICQECRIGYWRDVENNECKARKIISNCSIYLPDTDKCKTCDGDHVLIKEQTECAVNPTGEVNCEKYDATGAMCLECRPYSYLSDNKCRSTTKISNCAYYSTQNRCSSCVSDLYQLQNSPKTLEDQSEILNYCFRKELPGCAVEIEN